MVQERRNVGLILNNHHLFFIFVVMGNWNYTFAIKVMAASFINFTRIKVPAWKYLFIDILTKNIFLLTYNLKIAAYLLLSHFSPWIFLPSPLHKMERSGNQWSNFHRNWVIFYELLLSFCVIFLSNDYSTFYFAHSFHLGNIKNFE